MERGLLRQFNIILPILASSIGNALQFYDFFLYGLASALVFGPSFFPLSNPILSTSGAFVGYAVGFVSRPLGGIVFGSIGDRYGRKTTLTWTLSLMGGATFLIGLLPTYQQAGIIAPIALITLRLIQGFAAGGEWSGGILMATENAPPKRQGFYGAWSQAGVGVGFILSSGLFFLFRAISGDQFLNWGWRLPFLVSILVVVLGILIRLKVSDTAEFTRSAAKSSAQAPMMDVVRGYKMSVLAASSLILSEMIYILLTTTVSLSYGAWLHVNESILIASVFVSMTADTVMMIMFGKLADILGAPVVYGLGILCSVISIYPFFLSVGTGNPYVIMAAFVITNGVFHAAMIGTQPGLLTALFPVHVRSSGLALGQSIASVIVGFVPLISTTILYRTGSFNGVIVIFYVVSVISFCGLVLTCKKMSSFSVRAVKHTSCLD
ncbi:MFS transporter [Komagataeibacter sp. FNDCR2]|uniref:MFS transporter n=1 Tax=Komagataeibacter sp. FNDCR2 TaxID=2878682 RepID=UPI001E36F017|nr:MFS transporter [Komagataeibacter sp. FNDCR2]